MYMANILLSKPLCGCSILSLAWKLACSLFLGKLLMQRTTLVTCEEISRMCSFSGKGVVNCTGKGLDHVPKGLPNNTRILILDNNKIEALLISSFHEVPKLQKLSITNNAIKTIESGTFHSIPGLLYLDLSANPIGVDVLEESVFSALPSIQELHLQNMDASLKLENESLKGLQKTPLKLLDFSHNRKICYLPNDTFSYLGSLKELKLEYCECKDLNTWAFRNNSNLTSLYLTYNRLPDFPVFTETMLPALEVLDLNGSKISNLYPPQLTGLKKLKTLQLTGNDINHLHENLFYNLSQLETLYLDDNRIRKIDLTAFKSKSLKTLYLQDNRFILNDNHVHLFRQAEQIEEIFLGNTGFEGSVLENIFQNLTTLKTLRMTSMENFPGIPDRMLQGLSQLENLILSHNQIFYLDRSMFFNLTHLKVLYLDQNRIPFINVSSFPLDVLRGLERIHLGSNPFQCTCELLWGIDWINSTNVTVLGLNDTNEYVCVSPNNLAHRSILEVSSYINDKKCLTQALSGGLVAAMVLSTTFVLIIFTTSALYRYKWKMRYWIFHLTLWLKPERNPNPTEPLSYNFDVFVSYNSADSAWVKSMLVPKLEPTLRLCLFERDWLGGHDTVDCIQESIELSRYTLLIVTNSYACSQWSQLELTMAQHNLFNTDNEGVILAIMDDIDPMYMTPRLTLEMKRRDYLEWTDDEVGQSLFWERLGNMLQSEYRSVTQSLPPRESMSSLFNI